MTLDPAEKRIPKERLFEALAQIPQPLHTVAYRAGGYNLQWTELTADMGGRTRMVFFDPNDTEHKKAWAGSVSGGLWYNNNITVLQHNILFQFLTFFHIAVTKTNCNLRVVASSENSNFIL